MSVADEIRAFIELLDGFTCGDSDQGSTSHSSSHTAATWKTQSLAGKQRICRWLLQCVHPPTLASLLAVTCEDLQTAVVKKAERWPAGLSSVLNILATHIYQSELVLGNRRSTKAVVLARHGGHGHCIFTPSMHTWCEKAHTEWRRAQLVAINGAAGVCATSRRRAQLEFMRIVDILKWTPDTCRTMTYDDMCVALQSLPRNHRDTRFICNVLTAIRACAKTAFPLFSPSDALYIKAMHICTQQSHGKRHRRKDDSGSSSSSDGEPSAAAGECKAIPTDAMERLHSHVLLETDAVSVEERAVFLLLTTLALRVSGIVRLCWTGILDDSGAFREIGHTLEKGGKMRGFVLHPRLCDTLRAHLANIDKMGFPMRPRYVFCGLSAAHTHRSQRWVNLCVSRWGKAVGINPLYPHMFRHTLITDLVTKMHNSVDIVAKFIDHSSPAVTERYVWRETESAGVAAAETTQIVVDKADLDALMSVMTDKELEELQSMCDGCLTSMASSVLKDVHT